MTEDPANVWNNKTGSFIKRPGKGWLHADEKLETEEVVYQIKYIGMIPVNEPMKSLSFEMRTLVARESIRRVAEAAQSTSFQRKNKKVDDNINRILSAKPEIQGSGTDVALHVNIQILRVNRFGLDELLFQHQMQNISFACGGDTDIQDYVAYVAKDDLKRACYVFQCPNNLANNVITTIGQAFELRFKKFLGAFPPSNNSNGRNNGAPPPLPSTNVPNANMNSPNDITQALRKQSANGLVSQQNTRPSPKIPPTHTVIDENLHNMEWFHGPLSREDAEKMLKRDGDYMVRVSIKAEKQYVLSGRYQGECRHIILIDPSGTVRTKDSVFESIHHLIKYHQDHNIPITSRDNELLLLYPVSKHCK